MVPLSVPELPREFVLEFQRRRAVDAVAQIAHDSGIRAVTVADVCKVAKMGRATFYERFEGVSDCLRYAFATAYRAVFGPLALVEGEDRGEALLEAKLEALYAAVARHPILAELCLVHCYGAPNESAGFDLQAGARLVNELLLTSRPRHSSPPPLGDECLGQAIVSLAALRLWQGRADGLETEWREMAVLVGANRNG